VNDKFRLNSEALGRDARTASHPRAWSRIVLDLGNCWKTLLASSPTFAPTSKSRPFTIVNGAGELCFCVVLLRAEDNATVPRYCVSLSGRRVIDFPVETNHSHEIYAIWYLFSFFFLLFLALYFFAERENIEVTNVFGPSLAWYVVALRGGRIPQHRTCGP
jgi:hypothetical protein